MIALGLRSRTRPASAGAVRRQSGGRPAAPSLGDAARPPHHRQVGVVQRLDQHHLVARLDQPEEAIGQRLGRAGGDQHLGLPVDVEAVENARMLGDGLRSSGQAHHRRILVVAVESHLGGARRRIGRAVVVGKALPEVDRLVLIAPDRDITSKMVDSQVSD